MKDIARKLREMELAYRDRCIQTPADSSLYEVLDELRTFSIHLAQIFEQAEQKELTSDAAETGEREGAA